MRHYTEEMNEWVIKSLVGDSESFYATATNSTRSLSADKLKRRYCLPKHFSCWFLSSPPSLLRTVFFYWSFLLSQQNILRSPIESVKISWEFIASFIFIKKGLSAGQRIACIIGWLEVPTVDLKAAMKEWKIFGQNRLRPLPFTIVGLKLLLGTINQIRHVITVQRISSAEANTKPFFIKL